MLYFKKFIICISLIINSLMLYGQAEFLNVMVSSSEGQVTIYYDVKPTVERAVLKSVNVLFYVNGEEIRPKTLSGAIGSNVAFGTGHRLVWNCGADNRVFNGKVDFVLESDCDVPSALCEPETLLVEGGSFMMGSENGDSDEKPVHKVSVSRFRMGKFEITVGQYLCFSKETNSHFPAWLEIGNSYHIETGSSAFYKNMGYQRTGNDDLPIVGVSWNDAIAYCQWLSKKTGKTYRLPTEAEREYAARGGKQSKNYTYSGSNNIDEVAWYSNNSGSKTHSVGGKQANELGLYDMSGNVWEWCGDWKGDYNGNVQSNPIGAVTGSSRVLRGGGWNCDPQCCRVARRYDDTPTDRDGYVGFRVVFVP
jgi:formylglycine-generating enzyme required for sulfatase activity